MTLVFLAPLLVIVLIVWYKIRKNRMLNETMLKLAERGVMPPAEAMEALGSTRLPPAPPPAPGVPIYEQAKLLRQRSAWSDLRKGVMLVAVGLALTAYSAFDDGSRQRPRARAAVRGRRLLRALVFRGRASRALALAGRTRPAARLRQVACDGCGNSAR